MSLRKRFAVAMSVVLMAVCGACKRSTPASSPEGGGPGDAGPRPAAQAGDAKAGNAGNGANAANFIKLSEYRTAGDCWLSAAPDGTLHAVFTDRPDPFKPYYVYYRASRDGGATWSEPRNVSDAESGEFASFARCVVDAKGRAYAVWKYTPREEILDGPGGDARGVLAFRCVDGPGAGGAKVVRLNDMKVPVFSWFTAAAPDGTARVVWSQAMADDDGAASTVGNFADVVWQATLDGPAAGQPQGVITPKPLPTKEQQKAAAAAGHYPSYYETHARPEGLIDLSGYVDAAGAPHFVAEDPGTHDESNSATSGRRIVLFDGKSLRPLYEYQKGMTYNTFDNPPALLVDAKGKEHLVRAPETEKVEKACVRDYELEDGKPGEPVQVQVAETPHGAITAWQASPLPGGKMAVTVALSPSGMTGHDRELYLSFSEGGGRWTAPQRVTNNAAAAEFRHAAPGSIDRSFNPHFASVAAAKDGRPCLLMVNSEDSVVDLNRVGVAGGALVNVNSGFSSEYPMVFFMKP